MSSAVPGRPEQAKPRFPWLLLLAVVVAIYAFWILPAQLGPRQVKVQYEGAAAAR